MGDFFKQSVPAAGAVPSGGGAPPDPSTATQGGGFGQGLLNFLSNPLVGTALSGGFGALTAPRLGGLGGAIGRGGLMAMSNLPNLMEAQQRQQLLPLEVQKEQLGLQQARERQQAIQNLPTNMADMQNMSPRALAQIDPQMMGPMMELSMGRTANTQSAALFESMAQDPKYAGSETGQLLHMYAGQLSVAPKYVPFNDLMKLVLDGRKDEADILLKGGQYEETQARVHELIPAQAAHEQAGTLSELASANKNRIEANLAPQEIAIKQQNADASTSRANVEWAKVPVEKQKQIDAVSTNWLKTAVMPGGISKFFGSDAKWKSGFYQDLINHGATPDIAASKVRAYDPYFTPPTGMEEDETAATFPSAPTAPSGPRPVVTPGMPGGTAGTSAAPVSSTVGGAPAAAGGTVGGVSKDDFLKRYGVS